MKAIYILYILIFAASGGGYDKEVHPLEIPVCVADETGKRVEDSSCGLKACLKWGRERAAQIWGQFPGVGFGLMCQKEDGSESAKEGAEKTPGHGSMNWQDKDQ